MTRAGKGPALDRFRLLAAVLVVCIHTSPLQSYTALGDFWLTRVLARTAVPFFFLVTGYFVLGRAAERGRLRRFVRGALVLYGAAMVLYLPLNWYNGGYSAAGWVRSVLVDGTLYHLWYFPAVILGVGVARLLLRLGRPAALTVAGVLYLIGLGGDSYYGLVTRLPGMERLYDGLFTLCGYTRNGLFFAPLFLLLGAAGIRLRRRAAAVGFLTALAAMTAEGLVLRALNVQRHDSMYLALPVCMVTLFSLLLSVNRGRDARANRLSRLVYVLHPWCIVLVRGGARVVGLTWLLVENSLVHFAAVLALTLALSAAADLLRPVRPVPRAWKEIDRGALRHNAAALQAALASGCRLMAVVKADAYGHGAALTARCLHRAGVRAFAVASLGEGIALRKRGIGGAILILGYTPPEQAPRLTRWRLIQAVVDEPYARALSAQGTPVRVHLALDTGMHRLGISAEDRAAIARVYRLPHLKVRGVFSHLCVADSRAEEDRVYTRGQLDAFYQTVAWMRQHGYDPGAVHVQASYGIWNLERQPCNFARAGIALYGVCSDEQAPERRLDLRPVLALRARVACVRTVSAGEGAGYGLAFRARRETRLAVVTIGYADGLPRSLAQGGGRALIGGRSCPMVGRLCMDQTLVDVTDLPDVAAGQVVTIIGRDGQEEIRAEEVAVRCGTITNELLSRLGSRLERRTIWAGRAK